MQFFETTPTGRIQNLFSRNLDEGNHFLCILFSCLSTVFSPFHHGGYILFFTVDVRLPITVERILQNMWIVLFAILFVCLIFPWFVIPLLILAVFYYVISKIFR